VHRGSTPTKGHDDRFFLNRKNCRFGSRGPVLSSATELRLRHLATVF
jgi:hypothetical protein